MLDVVTLAVGHVHRASKRPRGAAVESRPRVQAASYVSDERREPPGALTGPSGQAYATRTGKS